MDSVGPIREQLMRVLRTLSPRQRATIAVAALAACAGFGGIVFRSRDPSYVPALDGQVLSVEDAAAARRALAAAGLTDFRVQENTLLVPRSDRTRYDAALAARETTPANWGEAWERANASLGQFSADREREAVREIARAKLISRLLAQLPDIEHADVVWDEDQRVGWRRPPRVRATVYLKPRAGCDITPDAVRAVRLAVAGSKADLDPANIAVMDLARMVTYDSAVPGGDSDRAYDRALHLTAVYRERLEAALTEIEGVRISVRVEAAAVHPAPLPAAKPGGPEPAPITQRGGPNVRLVLSADAPAELQSAPVDDRHAPQAALPHEAASRVSVSIAIPATYYEQVLASRVAMQTGAPPQAKARSTALREVEREVIDDVKAIVARVVSAEGGETPHVSVASIGVAGASRIAAASFSTSPQSASPWRIPGWGPAAVVGGALCLLPLLRRRNRGGPLEPIPPQGIELNVAESALAHPGASDVSTASVGGNPAGEPVCASAVVEDWAGMPADDRPLAALPRAALIRGQPAAREFLATQRGDNWLPAVAGLTNEELSLLIACLPPDDVSSVLGSLTIERQREVLQRAACADTTDDEAVSELGRRLEQLMRAHRLPPGGSRRLQPEVDPLLRRARPFLAPSSRAHAPESIVSAPDSAAGLEPEAFSVESLATLDRGTLRALYERLSDADWSVALAVASPAVRRRLTASLPASAAAALQKALRHKRPVRLRDLEAVHRRMAAALAQLLPAVEAR